MRSLLRLSIAILLAAALHAGGGPGDVVLVVNADSVASLSVANAWIAARGLDPGHVVAVHGLPSHERITVEEFRGRILLPVLCELDRRGLAAQVQWIVYSADLPSAVDYSGDLTRDPPPTIGGLGSLTGLTLLAPLVIAHDPTYCLARAPNPLYRMNRIEQKLRWDALPEETQARWGEASRLHQAGHFTAAAGILAPLAAATGDPGIAYDYACALAMAGEAPAAMDALQAAERVGWSDPWHTKADDDLVSLRKLPAFTALIDRLTALVHPPPDSLAWDRRLVRLADGRPALAAAPVAGWLSAMLAVTSGRGLSVNEALRMLARARAADATRPGGTVYLMRNGDVRSTTRQWAFNGVVAALEELGCRAEISDGMLPRGRSDVIGLVAGSAVFDWPESGAAMLPGTIAEHLTSCGGMMGWNDGQTPLTEFLRRGAAGATGTVQEPYALQYKFPSPFVQVHYRRGSTLAEAVMQSVANPYQLLLVGDPLCAPWAEPPAWRITPPVLRAGRVELAAEPAAEGPALREVRVLVDGVLAARGAPGVVSLPVQGWPDGPHRIAVVGIAEGPLASQACAAFTVDTGLPVACACASSTAPLDGVFAITWEAPAGTVGVLTHLGRDLVALPGGQPRTFRQPAVGLGLGRSALQVEVRDPAGRVLARSRPVEVAVAPPELRPGSAEPPSTVPGIRLIPFDQESPGVVVAKSRLEGDWLSQAVGAEQARGELEAGWWLYVGEGDDLTQIQIRARRPVALAMDGAPVPLLGTEHWHFALVRLAPGWHRCALSLAPGQADLEVRVGVAGTAPIAGDACRCPPPAVAGQEE